MQGEVKEGEGRGGRKHGRRGRKWEKGGYWRRKKGVTGPGKRGKERRYEGGEGRGENRD